jgi:hypothetical protein
MIESDSRDQKTTREANDVSAKRRFWNRAGRFVGTQVHCCTALGTTSQKLPQEIFRHVTENRSIFWISTENGPFSGFFSDTKIRSFLEQLFLGIT